MKCSRYGGSRHTKNGCFKFIGYPEWWDDLQWKKAATKALVNRAGGKALFTVANPTGGRHTVEVGEEKLEDGEGDGTKNAKKEEREI